MEENDHHQHHQKDGFEECAHHRIDGFVDELGGIVDDVVFETFGEILFQFFHGLADGRGGFQGVGAGALEDGKGEGRAAVEVGVDVVVKRAELDPRDIGEADQAVVVRGFDNDFFKLRFFRHAALGSDVDLEGNLLIERFLTYRSCSDFHVLGAQGGDDFVGGNLIESHALWIEPDAHRVFSGSEQADFADAIDAAELFTDLKKGVVGDVTEIESAVFGEHLYHEQEIG